MSQDAGQAAEKKPADEREEKAAPPKWIAKWGQIVTWTLPFIVISIGLYFTYVWHTPDVRYEPGAYYRSGDIAVASLKLQNYGTVDAEDISIETSFPEPIERDVTTSDDATPFTVKSGGKGNKAVVGTVARLVPDQSVTVYYAIHNPQGPIPSSAAEFVGQIVYKGGKARLGHPWGWFTWMLLAVDVVLLGNFVRLLVIIIHQMRHNSAAIEANIGPQNRELDALIEGYKADCRREMAEVKSVAQAAIAAAFSRKAVQALAEEIVAALRAPRSRKRSDQPTTIPPNPEHKQQTTDPTPPAS